MPFAEGSFSLIRRTLQPFPGDGRAVNQLSRSPMAERADQLPPCGERIAAALEPHRAALRRYLRVLGADGASADDLVQEAVLVALRRSPPLDVAVPGRVFAFLRVTARHLWLKDVRRRRSLREVEQADEVWSEECGDGVADDYMAALRDCVGRLPARSRELLRRSYERGDGRARTAEALGLSEHGVKSALRRLRAALRRCIEQNKETR